MTDNKLNQQPETLKWSHLYLLVLNSKLAIVQLEMHHETNLHYYSPNPNFFFYGTANVPLPCTNVKIIKSIKRKFYLIPKLQTNQLQDGFRSFAQDSIQ